MKHTYEIPLATTDKFVELENGVGTIWDGVLELKNEIDYFKTDIKELCYDEKNKNEEFRESQKQRIDEDLRTINNIMNKQQTAIDNKMHLNEIYMKAYMEEHVKTQTNIIENKLKRDTKIIIGLIVLNIIGIITGIIL